MNIKDLQVFIHLSDNLHFNRTAQYLHMTPSTLSRVIQRLESEFGQQFFERDNRSVKLTLAGKRMRLFAEKVLTDWQFLKQDFSQDKHQLTGRISIYCTVTAAHLYLPKLIEQFRALHPFIDIVLETGDVANAYHKISEQQVDFAFAVAENKKNSKFEFKHMQFVPFQLVAPKQLTHFSHFLSEKKIEWGKVPFVLPESGPAYERVSSWFQEMEINPLVYAKVAGHEAMLSIIALGCGVGAIPEPVIELSPVKNKLQILGAKVMPKPFDLGIICLKKRLKTPQISAFWELVNTSYST